MVFKSDKQRTKVMAMLRGGTHAAVSPQIIREANVLKPGLARQEFIRDRKSGLTISQSLKKLTDKAIREAKSQRERKTTKLVKKLIKKNPKLKVLFKKQSRHNIGRIKTFKLRGTINGEDLGTLNVRSRTKKLAIQQGIKEAKLDARFSPGVKIKVKVIK